MNYLKDICIHIIQILAEPYSPRAKIISPFVLRIEIVFFIDGKQKYSGSHQKNDKKLHTLCKLWATLQKGMM